MAVAQSNEGFRSLLKKRNFVRLWLAQLISMTVFNATNYALIVLIGKVTGSTFLIGLVIICFSLPAVLIGAPAGVFVDRMDKRRVLWLSNCLRALIMLIFVLILFANRSSVLIPIYLLTFTLSAIGQFFSPAEGSAIPMLVSEQELTSALSLFNITFMLSQALGYILLAPIALTLLPTITLFGIQMDAFIQLNGIIVFLYLICAFLIISIPPTALVQPKPQQKGMPDIATQTLSIFRTVWEETKQGWNFIDKRKLLYLAVVQLSFAGVLILIIGQLALPIVKQMLGLQPDMMAFVFAPAGIGLVVGSFLMPRVLERLGRSQTVFIGTTVMSIAMLLAPLAALLAHILMPHAWNQNPLLLIVVGILMFFAGMSLDCINIPAQASMQERSPDWIKGRVLSLQLVLYNAVSIPIILFTGALTDLFRVDRVLYMIAVCVFLFGLWSLSYERKHINDTPSEDYQQEEEQILIAEITSSEVTTSKNA
jgi:Major Facilitator Superfamily.